MFHTFISNLRLNRLTNAVFERSYSGSVAGSTTSTQWNVDRKRQKRQRRQRRQKVTMLSSGFYVFFVFYVYLFCGCRRAVVATGDSVRFRSLRFAPTHIHRPYSRRNRVGCSIFETLIINRLRVDARRQPQYLFTIISSLFTNKVSTSETPRWCRRQRASGVCGRAA
jgi:hypothetical protein